MNIIPDPLQVLLNTLPFLVAVLGMYRIILKPTLDHLLAREAAISGGQDEAASIEAEINARMAAYEAKVAQARGEVAALRAERRAEAQAKYDEIVGAARTEAEGKDRCRCGRDHRRQGRGCGSVEDHVGRDRRPGCWTGPRTNTDGGGIEP